jgi:hypothetical protein
MANRNLAFTPVQRRVTCTTETNSIEDSENARTYPESSFLSFFNESNIPNGDKSELIH